MRHILTRVDWQVALLDVEASALGPGSYPIEVGVALVRGKNRHITTWSTLIRPTQAWKEEGRWSFASEGVHGVSLSAIEQQGRSVHEVCDWLNSALKLRTVVATDAPRYDQDWLDALFTAAGREQRFTLHDLSTLTHEFSSDQHRHFAYLLRGTAVPHRAGADACGSPAH